MLFYLERCCRAVRRESEVGINPLDVVGHVETFTAVHRTFLDLPYLTIGSQPKFSQYDHDAESKS